MKSPRQWSIRRMFLWVFAAALICSQVSHLYHTSLVELDDFTITGAELNEWISQLDPSARADARGGHSGQSVDEVHSEFDYWISADTASAEQVLSHLKECVSTRASAGGWTIFNHGGGGNSESGHSFEFLLSKGISRFRIYCWTLTIGKPAHAEQLERQRKKDFRLKVLQFGYTQR